MVYANHLPKSRRTGRIGYDAFQNNQGFVPAYYLFNAEGKRRGFAAGERGLDMMAPTLKRLLAAATTQEAAS